MAVVHPDGSYSENGREYVPDDIFAEWAAEESPARPKNDRYSEREVDIDALLARPPKPVSWRCKGLVADATLTVLAGQAGTRKSQLAIFLGIGVSQGKPVGNIPCRKGTTLVLDGEMGPDMYIDRLRKAGVTSRPFHLLDGMGLDLSRKDDYSWLKSEIVDRDANFVVLDSLRRLAPSKRENDSDDMAPIISSLAKLARDTYSAILLVHHAGDNEDKMYRGSSTIKDQTDALFGLIRVGDTYRLTCDSRRGGKMRYAEEPPDSWLSITMTGVEVVDKPKSYKSETSVRDVVRNQILQSLNENPSPTKSAVADSIGRERDDNSFISAWKMVESEGLIAKESGMWRVVPLVVAGEQEDNNNGSGRVVPAASPKGADGNNTRSTSPYQPLGDFA